jgi:serine/threonine-protein kinase
MADAREVKFLALLVHRGLLSPEHARSALATNDPRAHLARLGVVTEAQWDEWIETEAGARPKLTRYELGDLLGEGGQARVFAAVDRKSGEQVALKILRPELARDRVVASRFAAESKLLIELRCDNIVRGQRVAREGPAVFCAMERIDGECLQDTLARDGRLDPDEALAVVVQVARALGHLHERGLVHRDVKPGNIMRANDGRAVLIDLGFAVGGGDGESATTAGTVHYISPEQARGHGGLDVRADIYSLGATLYHLVTGSLPFQGADNQEVLAKQVLESLSGERIREMELSPQVHYFIEKMMAKDKEIRFQDPAQIVREVEAYLAQRRHQQESGGDDRKPGVRRRRRKWL